MIRLNIIKIVKKIYNKFFFTIKAKFLKNRFFKLVKIFE